MAILTNKDGIIQSNIDLRQEIGYFMKTTEYKVLLQRLSQEVNCSCYKGHFGEGKTKCPKCLGTGKLFKFSTVKSYKQDMRFMEHMLFTNIGDVSDSRKLFFFEHDVHPQEGDYIWEVTWHPRTRKPVKLLNLYKVRELADVRGELGRIEYYVLWAEKENIDINFKNMYIGKAWGDRK